jgi:hypothetical protein
MGGPLAMRSRPKTWSRFKPGSAKEASRTERNGQGAPDAAFAMRANNISAKIDHHSSWDDDKESTRYLCARTITSLSFARYVFGRVVNERFRALAPSYGVNVAVVAKWALCSLQLRAQRDKHLALALIIGLFLAIALAFVWPWASIIALASLFTSAWIIVAAELLRRVDWITEHMLRGRFDPAAAPEPTRPVDMDRLAMVSKRRGGNLVVFRKHDAFVGSGVEISREHLVIDVSRGRISTSDGAKSSTKPSRFTNEDVHVAILRAMRKLGLADLRIEERLFVNGRHVHASPDLLPNKKEPPVSSVDCAVLKQAAVHPTPDARVYVCVEMPSWQGQLVVTMFARAVHVGGSLYIEWRFQVLPPVMRVFQRIDNRWLGSQAQTRRSVFRLSFVRTPRALYQAPLQIWGAGRQERRWRRHTEQQAESIDRGQIFDYGALPGIREEASGFARQHYFLKRDEAMFVLLAQEKLIRAISRFLDKMNIDIGQLTSQINVIVEETHKHFSLHVGGNISNSTIAVGDKAQAGGGPAK